MGVQGFNQLVASLPVVRKQVGTDANGTPLFVELHSMFAQSDEA